MFPLRAYLPHRVIPFLSEAENWYSIPVVLIRPRSTVAYSHFDDDSDFTYPPRIPRLGPARPARSRTPPCRALPPGPHARSGARHHRRARLPRRPALAGIARVPRRG